MDNESLHPPLPEHETAAASPSDLAPNEPASLPPTEEQKTLPFVDDEPDAGEAVPPDDSSSDTSSDGQHEGNVERIDGYAVHPAASAVPPMSDDQFDALVASIAERGLGEPIEFRGEELVEGRHRLKAIVLLRERGKSVEIRKQEWQPLGDETVAEYVKRKNLHRRHLTDAARLQIATRLFLLSEIERKDREHGNGRIQQGERRNPTGRNQRSAPKEDGETDSFPATDARSKNQQKTDRSARGRLAAQEKTTIHKADQAIRVEKDGTPEERAEIEAGRATQKDILKKIDERQKKAPAAKPKKQKRIDHPFKPETELQRDLLKGWMHLLDDKAAINQRAQARADMRLILDAEEKADKAPPQPRQPRAAGSKKSAPKGDAK